MKALFIWNKNLVPETQQTKQFNNCNDCKFITDEKSFNEIIKNWDNSYTKIYVLLDLDWQKHEIFGGLEKAYKIIEKIPEDKAPSIHLYSIIPKDIIRRRINYKYKFIVKAFPPEDILLQISPKYKFNTKDVNPALWRFIKYMTLTKYGILDNFLHRLESINANAPGFKKELNKLIAELKRYSGFVGDGILKHISNIEYTDEFVFELKNLIEKRFEEITGEKKERKIKLEKSIKILVIEDNESDLKLIEESLKRYSENEIKTTTSGKEALELVKKEIYNIIICDLELLDKNQFYQEVQGIEIIEQAQAQYGVAIGVITGLGRKGIANLLSIDSKYILYKKHLHRFNPDDEIDNLLKNLKEKLEEEDKKLKILYGPDKGYFTLLGFKKKLSEAFEDENFKEETWKKAFEILEKFKNGDLKPDEWVKTLTKKENISDINGFIVEQLHSLLAQRLILLEISLNNDGYLYPNEENDYEGILDSNDININKTNIDRICLSYKQEKKDFQGQKNVWKVDYKNLFPEEVAYIKKTKRQSQQLQISFKLKERAPQTFKLIETNFKSFNMTNIASQSIPGDINEWTYEDFYNVCNYIKDNYSGNKDFIELLRILPDYFTKSIESELYPVIPDFKQLIDDIVKLDLP